MENSKRFELLKEGIRIVDDVIEFIQENTNENPLVLFDETNFHKDEVCNYPYGYYVDRYGFSIAGIVKEIKDDEVTLFLISNNYNEYGNLTSKYGDKFIMQIDELPFDSLLDILNYLADRE